MWIKIESEYDLPESEELFLININEGKVYIAIAKGNDGRLDFWATHYQFIIKPEPPKV